MAQEIRFTISVKVRSMTEEELADNHADDLETFEDEEIDDFEIADCLAEAISWEHVAQEALAGSNQFVVVESSSLVRIEPSVAA